jgi:hypothetical protein
VLPAWRILNKSTKDNSALKMFANTFHRAAAKNNIATFMIKRINHAEGEISASFSPISAIGNSRTVKNTREPAAAQTIKLKVVLFFTLAFKNQ